VLVWARGLAAARFVARAAGRCFVARVRAGLRALARRFDAPDPERFRVDFFEPVRRALRRARLAISNVLSLVLPLPPRSVDPAPETLTVCR